jgi:hypothetical protein
MLKKPAGHERDILSAKLTDISRLVSPCFAWTFLAKFLPALHLDVSAGICQRALVDESGMIRTQTGAHKRLKNDHGAWDVLYNTTS